MTTIKSTCPMCGDVDLTPRDVTVTVAERAGWATYSFECVSCHDTVEKPAEADVVRLLRSAGVRVVTVQIPAEALETHAGPALSYDDVLDFALLLEASEDIVTALATNAR